MRSRIPNTKYWIRNLEFWIPDFVHSIRRLVNCSVSAKHSCFHFTISAKTHTDRPSARFLFGLYVKSERLLGLAPSSCPCCNCTLWRVWQRSKSNGYWTSYKYIESASLWFVAISWPLRIALRRHSGVSLILDRNCTSKRVQRNYNQRHHSNI